MGKNIFLPKYKLLQISRKKTEKPHIPPKLIHTTTKGVEKTKKLRWSVYFSRRYSIWIDGSKQASCGSRRAWDEQGKKNKEVFVLFSLPVCFTIKTNRKKGEAINQGRSRNLPGGGGGT